MEVKSIGLLKGTQAAIYGVNGSNGVISITLKQGKRKYIIIIFIFIYINRENESKNNFPCPFVLYCVLINMTAQKNNKNKKIIITGTVIDATNLPIVNAIILIDNVKTNSFTDSKGEPILLKSNPLHLKSAFLLLASGTFEDSIKRKNKRSILNLV